MDTFSSEIFSYDATYYIYKVYIHGVQLVS